MVQSKRCILARSVFVALLLVIGIAVMLAAPGCQSSSGGASPTSAPAASNPAQSAPASGGAVKTLRFADALNDDNPLSMGMVNVAKLVNEKSKGQLKIDVYANSQLGVDRALVEGMQMGTIDMVVTGSAPLAGFVPPLQVIDLPFMFKSYDSAHSVLDGPFSDDLKKLFDGKGFRALSFWEIGFRQVTNSKRPIKTPEDVKGLKIRVVENPIHQMTWTLLGAQPTPMAMTEVYNALQQRTIDAQENPANLLISEKLYEVQKYASLTGHVYTAAVPMISDKAWNSLTPDEQKIIADAVKETTAYERNLAGGQEADQLKTLESKGMQIEREPDRDKFVAAVAPVYDDFAKKYDPALLNKLRSIK